MSFFSVRGRPGTRKPRKTRGFLMAPKWNSGTTKGTKHRKTRCFWTPWAEYTVNYKGSGDPEVTPRSPPWGRRQGRRATITFGYQPKASGKDTGWPSWPAPGFYLLKLPPPTGPGTNAVQYAALDALCIPGFKGLRLTAGRRPKGPYVRLG